MRYRVEVHVGEFMSGTVFVDASSEDDAKAEAEQAVEQATIEALAVWEED